MTPRSDDESPFHRIGVAADSTLEAADAAGCLLDSCADGCFPWVLLVALVAALAF